MRPFTFLAHPGGSYSGKQLAEVARRAESLGYTGLVFPDHLGMAVSPIPAMATVLAATDTLRAAPFVLNVDLHQPAVLAQDLASLDVLSEGRVDVAIGAGWNKPEYDATGLSFDPVGRRVARLTEAIAILKGCFGDTAFSLTGEHYTVTDFNSQPKPVQKPHPPFFIGGGGRRTLELAAREADVVGFAPRLFKGGADPRSMTFEATAEKMEWVKAAAGDRVKDLQFNAYPSGVPVTVTDDLHGEARKVIDFFRERSGHELTEQEVIDSPHLFIGSIRPADREVRRTAGAPRHLVLHDGRCRRPRSGRRTPRRDVGLSRRHDCFGAVAQVLGVGDPVGDRERLEGRGPRLVIRTARVRGDGRDELLAEVFPLQTESLDERDGHRQCSAFPRRGEDQLAVVAGERGLSLHVRDRGVECAHRRATPIIESRVTSSASSASVLLSVPAGRSGSTM